MAASMTFLAPMTLVRMASNGLYSQDGICLRAAAWKTTSTPCMASARRSRSRTSPRKKRSEGWLKRFIISDCLSSSRLKMASRRGWYVLSISSTSLVPKDPVPPVTRTDVSRQFNGSRRFTLFLPAWGSSHAPGRLGFRELQPVEAGVRLAAVHELGVAPDGLHAAAVEHHDLVGVQHGGEAVGDGDGRDARHHPVERLLHEPLGLAVERAGRLVQDQDVRPRHQRAG